MRLSVKILRKLEVKYMIVAKGFLHVSCTAGGDVSMCVHRECVCVWPRYPMCPRSKWVLLRENLPSSGYKTGIPRVGPCKPWLRPVVSLPSTVTLLSAVLVLVNTRTLGHPLADTHHENVHLLFSQRLPGHAIPSETFLSPRSFAEITLEDGHRPTPTGSCESRISFLGNLRGTSKTLLSLTQQEES